MIRTSPPVTGLDESITDSETDGVSGAPQNAFPSSSARVQSSVEFAKLDHVE